MRINAEQIAIIREEVMRQLGADAVVRLFGSRVDDTQRGGDIDLLVESVRPLVNRVQAECKLAASQYIKLGGRKVDVLIKDPVMPLQPIHQQALTHGVIL